MLRGAAGLAVVLACLAAAAPAATAQEGARGPTLAAAGTGRAFLPPDQAELYVTVSRVRATSRAARAATSRRLVRVRRALRRHGVAAADVRTAGVSVSRERVRRRGARARVRYRASAELTVRSRDIPGLGALVDAVADAGADVFGPDFSVSDPSQGLVLATRDALADARRRADDAAAQLGLRITGIASVDLAPLLLDGSGGDESGAGADAGGGGTRIAPGREEFAVSVRVVYTVAPA